MCSRTSLVKLARFPDVHCRFCSPILRCKYKCTHLAMKLHILSHFVLSIYMFSLTSLVSLATIPDVHCRFCSQILCKYKCTHLAMQLHRRPIFVLSIYMFSLTSLVKLATIPDVHCRFCSKTCKCRVQIQLHIIGNGILPISVGCTGIAPSFCF